MVVSVPLSLFFVCGFILGPYTICNSDIGEMEKYTYPIANQSHTHEGTLKHTEEMIDQKYDFCLAE